MKQGWTWLINSPRWHYFVKGKSLCGRWMIISDANLEIGNDNSPDNCKACRKKLSELKCDEVNPS